MVRGTTVFVGPMTTICEPKIFSDWWDVWKAESNSSHRQLLRSQNGLKEMRCWTLPFDVNDVTSLHGVKADFTHVVVELDFLVWHLKQHTEEQRSQAAQNPRNRRVKKVSTAQLSTRVKFHNVDCSPASWCR